MAGGKSKGFSLGFFGGSLKILFRDFIHFFGENSSKLKVIGCFQGINRKVRKEITNLKRMYDEPRRPRRGALAADQEKNHENEPHAPPCLGEALRRGTIINQIILPENYINLKAKRDDVFGMICQN